MTLRDKAATHVPRSVLNFHKVPRDIRFERIPAVRGAAAPASAQKLTEIRAILRISGHCQSAVDWPGPRGPNQVASNLGEVLITVNAPVGVDGPLGVLAELDRRVRVRAAGRVGAAESLAAVVGQGAEAGCSAGIT